MKNKLKISILSLVCVLGVGFADAQAASSVRTLGGTGTYVSASSAANAESGGTVASIARGGSVRVSPTTSQTTTSSSSESSSGTRVVNVPRLSIGQYLGGGTSVSGGSSLRPQTPSTGSSSGGGTIDPGLTSELQRDVDQLKRDFSDLADSNDRITEALNEKQNILLPDSEGFIDIDQNTNEIYLNIEPLKEAISDIVGQSGREIEIGHDTNQLQWHYVDDPNWNTIISFADLAAYGNYAVSDDLADFVKADEMETAISQAITNAATNYATKSDLDLKADKADLENYATTTDLENYATTESLATVATTGSYNDLSDKPVIPEGVVVDEAITAQGTNPVQGKAVYEALAGKQAVGDYATNTDLSDVRSTAESAQSDATSALSAAAEAKTLAGTKVTANEDIVAGTGTKITYDAKGLVTGSANLEVADLPDAIPTTKISGLATVATSGSYNDLADTPVIPDAVVVDETITAQGTNPVQGKAVYEALAGKQPVGDYATTESIAKMENTDNKATSITVENQASPTAYPSVSAIVQWTNDKILELSEEGLPVSPDNIGAGSITEDKLDAAVVNKIDGKEDKTNKVSQIDDTNKTDETKYVSVKAVADYVIPKPSKDCTAQSGLCVLSATTDGGFAWVNVTAPAGEN